MLLKKRCFTWVELMIVIAVLVALASIVAFAILVSRREDARRANCAGNLKCLGLSLLMYSGDFAGYFPADHPNGTTNFEPLGEQNYLVSIGKIWACPSRKDVLTTAANSSYVYIGSGLKDDHPYAGITSLVHDAPGNHPGNYTNVLFIDGHVEGGYPGKAPFLPAK